VFGRRFQFGLASLLLLFTAVAIACGWMARETYKARRQRELVANAQKINCSVVYDYNVSGSGGLQMFTGMRPGTTWLHRWLGDDFFHEIVGAQLRSDDALELLRDQKSIRMLYAHDSMVSDKGLQVIGRFHQLQWLDLRDAPQVTDAGLKHLTGLVELKQLWLRRTAVGDQGMIYLRDMTQLEELDLGMTQVTNEGLKQLGHLTNLKQLLFWGNRIEDTGLAYTRAMKNLETLELGGAPITDDGFANLSELIQMRRLMIRGSQVTDAGLKHFAKLQKLEELDLFNTKVSNKSLSQLMAFPNLQTLYLGETQVDDEGVKQLQLALPACKIVR